MKKVERMENRIRRMDAGDERQYMINESYEVYEKQGIPVGAAAFHYHSFYEIIYVMEGEFSSLVEDRTYLLQRGDFLLISPDVMHKYHPVEKKFDTSRRIILWITDNMLRRLSDGELNLAACFEKEPAKVFHFPVYYEEMLRGYLLKLAMSQVLEQEEPGAKLVMDRGYLLLFFAYLNTLCQNSAYLSSDEAVSGNPLVEQVSTYIDAHLESRITLEDLAGQVHMSKYHFLRKFKEYTGVTVHTFLINKRLIRACESIREGMSIAEAWQSCGFTDYSSFLRNFKAAYGISPGKYLDFY